MKLRKHKGNKLFKITWAQRAPTRVETHLRPGGKTEKVVISGEFIPRQAVLTEGHNPTACLNAFFFGRDRFNIDATIRPV